MIDEADHMLRDDIAAAVRSDFAQGLAAAGTGEGEKRLKRLQAFAEMIATCETSPAEPDYLSIVRAKVAARAALKSGEGGK